MSTSVSGPTHLVVSPVSTSLRLLLGKKQPWWLVWGFGLWGRCPVFLACSLGSLNDLCARCRNLHDVGTPSQSIRSLHAHEALMFLSLVMIHSLRHPEGQSLYMVWFGWGIFLWIRVWWKQVCFNSSHASHRSGKLPVTFMGVMSQRFLPCSCHCVDDVALWVS